MKLDPSEKVVAMQRDRNARGRHAFTVRSRDRNYLILTQKLPLVRDFINSELAHDELDQVSMSSLYEAKDKKQRSAYHKLMWAVDQHASYEDALHEFERTRQGYGNVCLLGTKAAFRVACT